MKRDIVLTMISYILMSLRLTAGENIFFKISPPLYVLMQLLKLLKSSYFSFSTPLLAIKCILEHCEHPPKANKKLAVS